jgi:nucleotide-binding universal stress UspA family protein
MRRFEPKKILVPIDFSEVSADVLQAGVEIGERWGAEVMALHVAREGDYIPSSAYDSAFPPLPYGEARASLLTKFREDARSRLEHQIETMLRKAGGGRKNHSLILWGEPARDIVQMAENGGFDLIVMATHGRRGLNRMFLGSVTEEVLRHAPCPVFAIRIKGPEELRVGAEVEAEALVP